MSSSSGQDDTLWFASSNTPHGPYGEVKRMDGNQTFPDFLAAHDREIQRLQGIHTPSSTGVTYLASRKRL